jgi:hypothetical protein
MRTKQPDSGARPEEPEWDGSLAAWPGAPDSVRCAPNLIVSLTDFLSWFVLNLMHLR